MMGSNDGASYEKPVHRVELDGFWMGKYEVTNAEYRMFRSSHSSGDYKGKGLNDDRQPVARVSWNDAQAFVKWLNGRSGGRYTYALPTEAEWEYAARGGTTTSRYWGNDSDDACTYANVADQTAKRSFSGWTIHDCDDGYAVSSPVGSFRPNGFGLYDMMGNVWEWCQDWYGKDAYSSHSRKNPIYSRGGSSRVYRGGSWSSAPGAVRSALRGWNDPGYAADDLGFRLLRTQ
jgi:formylglycine-generating enzyme required for sulfatase activity